MNFFRSMDISASALTAQRYRMDIIGENVANATTTRTAEGGPYRRKYVVMETRQPGSSFADLLKRSEQSIAGGVRITATREDPTPFKLVYDPTHPDAQADGFVRMPNVDLEREVVDMISATRSYEANITVINNFKAMASRALQIGRG